MSLKLVEVEARQKRENDTLKNQMKDLYHAQRDLKVVISQKQEVSQLKQENVKEVNITRKQKIAKLAWFLISLSIWFGCLLLWCWVDCPKMKCDYETGILQDVLKPHNSVNMDRPETLAKSPNQVVTDSNLKYMTLPTVQMDTFMTILKIFLTFIE